MRWFLFLLIYVLGIGQGLLREWGHHRWGLGHEAPRYGTDDPRWYWDGSVWVPVRSSASISFVPPNSEGPCDMADPNNDPRCVYRPTEQQTARASLMFDIHSFNMVGNSSM